MLCSPFVFFYDSATTEIYTYVHTLSLHDSLPIFESMKAEAAIARLAQVRLPQLPHGEMKWDKVSAGKLSAYCRTVRSFFDDAALATAHFHCLEIGRANV